MGVERKLPSYKIDISHQEMDRIVGELEALFTTTAEAGGQWIAIESAANWLQHELGYEDQAEFEDALHGSFEQFLTALPTVTVGRDDKDRPVFKIKQDPPRSEWRPVRLELRVTDRKDLWNVLLKAPASRIEVPELEFEISEDSKRKIDSVYNHIAAAIFNLSTHVRTVPLEDETKNKIVDCIMQLNELLDVEKPWTLVVHDPSGLSEFSDMDGVIVTHPTTPSDAAAEGGGQQGSGGGGGDGQQQQQEDSVPALAGP